jgi:hypothetical protein
VVLQAWKCYKSDCFRKINSSYKRHLICIRTIWIACPYFDVLGIVGVSILEEVSSPILLGHRVLRNNSTLPPEMRLNICLFEKLEFYKCAFYRVVFPVVLPCILFVLYLVLKWFLCEVVNSKGEHLMWEEFFKILLVRIHKNLLLHFTWYIPGSHLKISLQVHRDVQLWYTSWVTEETLIQIVYILCGYPEFLKIECWDGALK